MDDSEKAMELWRRSKEELFFLTYHLKLDWETAMALPEQERAWIIRRHIEDNA